MTFQPIIRYEQNTKGKDYIVGDIHGMYDNLISVLNNIGFDKSKDRLFSVGDLIDRGPKSLECTMLLKEDWFYAVRANHEQWCIDAFNLEYDYKIRRNVMASHCKHGGSWFYNLDDNIINELITLYKNMPYMIEVEVNNKSIGIVHGDILNWDITSLCIKDAPQSGNRNDVLNLMWNNSRLTQNNIIWSKGIDHVFLGHTPVSEITTLGNCHYIDTGAVFNNTDLVILCIEDYINSI